jgi:hypothetical protein
MEDWGTFDKITKTSILNSTGTKLIKQKPIKKIIEEYHDPLKEKEKERKVKDKSELKTNLDIIL